MTWLASIIAAVIGFGGVIVTLICNARLARRAQEEEWQEDRRRREDERRHERDSLAAALQAELTIVARALRQHVAHCEQCESDAVDVAFPVEVLDAIYHSSIASIGLLPAEVVEEVVGTYTRLRTRSDCLRVIYRCDPRLGDRAIVPLEELPDEIENEKMMIASIEGAMDALNEAGSGNRNVRRARTRRR